MDVDKTSPTHVVITGSTRGIGFGLAGSFLKLGCSVTVSSRSPESVNQAVETLSRQSDLQRVFGCVCDVRQPQAVQALWDGARDRFGKVDVWINNAGISAIQMPSWKIPPEKAQAVIETNLLGVIHGCRVAVHGMLAQGFGGLYNMEGMGSNGRKHEGLALYGTTKYGLRYYTDCLIEETRDTPILIGALSPGMVITDLIEGQYEGHPEEFERAKRVFNLLADRVETVTPWLAEQVLANRSTGVRIAWLTRSKIIARMVASLFHKRDLWA
jgi:NAD(P)-dependent dehydrogenase (short-subunit alcohol dehydrogenase family)